MVDLHVSGLTNRAIAEIIDCTPTSVGIVLRSPMVKKEIQQRLGEARNNPNGTIHQEIEAADNRARKIIENNAPRAANTMVELLDSEDSSVQLRASTSILDRAIGKPESENASKEALLRIEIAPKDATLIMIALKECKEIPFDGQANESTANGQDADPSNLTQQVNVHQEALSGPRLGHRQTKTQTSTTGREVTRIGLSKVKLVKNLRTESLKND